MVISTALLLGGCTTNMWVGSKLKPLESSTIFADSRSSRPLVEGTVARGQLDADTAYSTGMVGGVPVARIPVPITRPMLDRGRLEFNVYCSPCHGTAGDGQGMIPRRGFTSPPSYHTDRLRSAPDGHFFDVITHGYGVMYSYADRVKPADRWAIVAYIRALQRSQDAALSTAPAAEQQRLQGGTP